LPLVPALGELHVPEEVPTVTHAVAVVVALPEVPVTVIS
jgi:hypothetical protein